SAYIDFRSLPAGLDPRKVVVQNNTFTRNDFTLVAALPSIVPTTLAVDGGGNICRTDQQSSDNPLVCNGTPPPPSSCDVNKDGVTNVADVQLEVNMALS